MVDGPFSLNAEGGMVGGVTAQELARGLGVSDQTVYNRVRDGMPVLGVGPDGERRFDLEACRAWCQMHVRGAGRGGKRPGAGRKSEAEKREAARADGGPETTEAAAVIGDKARLRAIHADLVQGMGVMDLVRVHGITAPLAKTLTDTYTAALKGLELETETRKLLKVEDARTAWLETLAFVDGVLQNLPGQVAAEVAAMLKLDALAQESVRVKVHAEVERARKQLRAGSPTIVGRPERALAG